jgi:hypothetical protein
MWCGSGEGRHGSHAWELHMGRETTLLLVSERAKQCTCPTYLLGLNVKSSISFSSVQMFEGTYSPPFYLDLYNFKDGAQEDIFLDSYTSIPPPSPTQREVPTPVNHSAPQPSQTGKTRRNYGVRTTGEPGFFGSLFRSLFSTKATYTRDLF